MLFYDLAGHTNYFNRNLVESVAEDVPHSIFIVLVSLKNQLTKVTERLVFWLNFLHHHLCSSLEVKPNVVVIGSHPDSRPFRKNADNERLTQVFTNISEQNPSLVKSFNFNPKPMSLDCRKFQMSEMRHLRNSLYKNCLKLAPCSSLPPSACYILSSLFLSNDFAALPALTLGQLAKIIADNSSKPDSLSLYHLLPTEVSKLLEICKFLDTRQRIILFSSPSCEEHGNHEGIWIVHSSYSILTTIDKQLASLNGMDAGANDDTISTGFFKDSLEKLQFSSGIITREILSRALPGVDLDLAIHLLQHFKYTETIDSGEFPSLGEQAFFLPGLLQEVGEPDSWEGSDFGFALSIRASKTQNGNVITYFLPRFLKNLLLCLIQKFILPIGHYSVQEKASSFDESSDNVNSAVWSRGVYWQVNGIHVHLVVNDNVIILSMYSKAGSEISCLSLRNKIVDTINEEKSKWQASIKTEAFLLSSKREKLPIEDFEMYRDHWIPITEIEQLLLDRKTMHKGLSLDSLFFFEPAASLLKMSSGTIDLISSSQSSDARIEQNVIHDIYKSFGRARKSLIDHFHFPVIDEETSLSNGSHISNVVVTEEDTSDDHVTESDHELKSSPKASSIDIGTGLDKASPKQEMVNVTELSCQEFSLSMASLSLFDFVNFLNQIKVSLGNLCKGHRHSHTIIC